jgi:acetyl-CoA carboxylase biotin carboxylase subunit
LTAENPASKPEFAPNAGQIKHLLLPGGFGVRVDTHIYQGYNVPPYYDSLLAKIIVWGKDRQEAIDRMARCLAETQVEGLHTTLPFHQRLMQDEAFRAGDLSTNFIRRRMLNGTE